MLGIASQVEKHSNGRISRFAGDCYNGSIFCYVEIRITHAWKFFSPSSFTDVVTVITMYMQYK